MTTPMRKARNMVFDIKNKTALITGGASGIGLCSAKEILFNGGKGVVIADVDNVLGVRAQQELEEEFGSSKCIFVQTDVSNYNQLEAAFLETVNRFGSIDILFNNAGVPCADRWERGIEINLNGTINGMLLGFEKYLPKYKQGNEAVIVNTSSVLGVNAMGIFPVYCAVKSAILSTVKSWGSPDFYEETKVRVVGLCPGKTNTKILKIHNHEFLRKKYGRVFKEFDGLPMQEPNFVGRECMKLIQFAPNGTVWIIEGGEPAYEVPFPHRSTIRKNLIGSN